MRRLITIPAVLLATLLFTGTGLFWLPLCLLLSLYQPWRGLARSLLFITCFLWCETVGILVSAWLWLRHGAPAADSSRWAAFLDGNARLQLWWAGALKHCAEVLFRLRFEVQNPGAFVGPPAIVMPRHVSMGDTVVPLLFYAQSQGLGLRYVLKRELLFDPCLDIVGNRLPNRFVDRASDDPAREIAGVEALVEGLGPNAGDSVLIYPEGTRCTPDRLARAKARLAEVGAPDLQALAAQLKHLLPPRTGGSLALLQANPGLDLLFLAHTGFEGSSHFSNLLNGSWIDARVILKPWRIAAADIPTDAAGQRALLFREWLRMDQEVEQLVAQTQASGQP